MTNKKKSTLNSKHLVFLLFSIMGGLFLWNEYRADLIGALPYLILLLCPLMHIFMHKGHGGHGDKDDKHDTHQRGAS